jgi:hypothetical protein
LHIGWSPPVSGIPGQENQGRVGVPRPSACIVCDLDCSDVSAGDDSDNHDNDDNLLGSRKTLCAIHVGKGLRLCPSALTTGGLQMQVLFNHCAAGPLPRRGSCCCHRCHPQSCVPLFVWLQCEQVGGWGGQQGSWGRTWPTTTQVEGNKVGEGQLTKSNNQLLMGVVQ